VEVDEEIVPDRNAEYLFYQALLGAWPPDLAPEGKQQSSWSNPNTAYEAALRRFVRAVLDASREGPFLKEFHSFVTSIARLGATAALSQLVLKLTVPGVPDVYQGSELWDHSLVDPDNRRPVDWNIRRRLLEEIGATSSGDLSTRWQDGREKLFVTRPCWNGGGLIRSCSPRVITSLSKSSGKEAGIFALSPATGAARRSSSPYCDWSTHCLAVVRWPTGARPRSLCPGTENGKTYSRAATWFCKSAFAFPIC